MPTAKVEGQVDGFAALRVSLRDIYLRFAPVPPCSLPLKAREFYKNSVASAACPRLCSQHPASNMAEADIKDTNPESRDSASKYQTAFRYMLLARIFEERAASLYRAGKIMGGVFMGKGQEAFSVGLGLALDHHRGDVYGPLIRDQAGRLAFGEPLIDAARTYLGSVEGPMRARDGNVHRGNIAMGLIPMISHLGSHISVVSGRLIGKRFTGQTGAIGGVCIGDGGTSTGAFHEALNQAAVEKLPLIIAVADNQFAYSTPTSRQFACKDLVDKAIGYGIEGHSIDATDLSLCLDTFEQAATRARDGQGPQLIIGHLLRLCGHGEHDDACYISAEKKQQAFGGDCLDLARQQLIEQDWASLTDIEQWTAKIQEEVEQATSSAQREPGPDPFQESWQALSTQRLAEGHTRA
ncbi:MAG: thiamine pyrophosphate-dependent dehydrogenase E1 component subunit alpha [Verrucomicrobiales bacterium]|nr:thiamine pyrophosphate-dependent dehydrogenase E1 component subunit alpha [Verrucomicrobiales bacterium]